MISSSWSCLLQSRAIWQNHCALLQLSLCQGQNFQHAKIWPCLLRCPVYTTLPWDLNCKHSTLLLIEVPSFFCPLGPLTCHFLWSLRLHPAWYFSHCWLSWAVRVSAGSSPWPPDLYSLAHRTESYHDTEVSDIILSGLFTCHERYRKYLSRKP